MYPNILYPATTSPNLSSAFYEIDLEFAKNYQDQRLEQIQEGKPGRLKLFLYPNSLPPGLENSSAKIRVFEDEKWSKQWMHVINAPERIIVDLKSKLDPSKKHENSSFSNSTSSRPDQHEQLGLENNNINNNNNNNHRHRHHHHQHQHHNGPTAHAPSQPSPKSPNLEHGVNNRLYDLREAFYGFVDSGTLINFIINVEIFLVFP